MNLRLPPDVEKDIKAVSKLQQGRSYSSLVATAWKIARAQIVGESKPKRQAVRS